MARFINPFTDWGFKKIFGQEINKDILIAFLNALFEGEKVIEDVTFLDKEQLANAGNRRGLIYDVYCTASGGEHIIVEMQNRSHANFISRTLVYVATAIANQRKRAEKRTYNIDAVYGIFFMNYTDGGLEKGRFRTDVVLADRDTHRQLTDKMRMIYLQLPCFEKNEDQCADGTLFDRFIYVLKNMDIYDRMPDKFKEAVFGRLAEIADKRVLSQEELDLYDREEMMLNDTLALYEGSMKTGEEKERRKNVRGLLAYGLSYQQIAEALQLDTQEVERLAGKI